MSHTQEVLMTISRMDLKTRYQNSKLDFYGHF